MPRYNTNMFGMYGSRMRALRSGSYYADSEPTIGHDLVNYMNPTVNYDKPPRKIRPRKREIRSDVELEPSDPQRTCLCQHNNNNNVINNNEINNHYNSGYAKDSHHMRDHSLDSLQRRRRRQGYLDVGRGEEGEGERFVAPQVCPIHGEVVRRGSPVGQGTPLHQGAEALVRMFNCLTAESSSEETELHGGRYTYSALEDEGGGVGGVGGQGAERVELEHQSGKGAASREQAGIAARSFCRSQARYTMLEHLNDIGSRIDKHWFLIRDLTVKTERLLTLHPHDVNSPVTAQPGSKDALIELFQAMQHPYIYPVLDVDFVPMTPHVYVVTVIPYNPKGTLKDLIYRSQWQEDWTEKYQQRACGLPVKQVQRLGRQILEALLYLQDRGFPPCGHLHSGNIVLQNGVARLSGLENTLLGLTSRIHPIIKRRIKENRDAIDSLCFGHVLFEMCAGYELSTAHPTTKHLDDISNYPQVLSVLEYIFGCGEQYPSVEEILCCDFFRNLDLREMRAMPLPFQSPYSPAVRAILREVRRHQKQRRKGKRGINNSCTLEGEGSTPTSSETSTGGGVMSGGNDDTPTAGSTYNTPTASLGMLTSPVSDFSLSPEK